ncbi:glycosyltransferase, partial [Musicola keenii]|uniref:glycosyltransferase n=1 Tax=Musicola keenii TaxID=2884250 RepID=UPI0017848A81
FHLFPSFYFSIFVSRNKTIIHEHNTDNRRRKIKWLKYVERYIYHRAKNVICISDAVKDSLSNWVGASNKFVVVPNFSRFDYKKTNKEIDGKKINILMVASFSKQKRHKNLIAALKYLPDNYFVHFLGDGPLLDGMIKYAKEISVSRNVIFHGESDNVSHYYNMADICVLLSNWEGFGMVVVEAASHNKVTIASKVMGLSEVIGNESFLISNDIDSKTLAQKITLTINAITERPDIYDDYCKFIAERYSFSSFSEQLNSVYENMI